MWCLMELLFLCNQQRTLWFPDIISSMRICVIYDALKMCLEVLRKHLLSWDWISLCHFPQNNTCRTYKARPRSVVFSFLSWFHASIPLCLPVLRSIFMSLCLSSFFYCVPSCLTLDIPSFYAPCLNSLSHSFLTSFSMLDPCLFTSLHPTWIFCLFFCLTSFYRFHFNFIPLSLIFCVIPLHLLWIFFLSLFCLIHLANYNILPWIHSKCWYFIF